MSIMRITVRTFQNEQHAEMFIAISQKIYEDALKDKLKVNFTRYKIPHLKTKWRVSGNMTMKNIWRKLDLIYQNTIPYQILYPPKKLFIAVRL